MIVLKLFIGKIIYFYQKIKRQDKTILIQSFIISKFQKQINLRFKQGFVQFNY